MNIRFPLGGENRRGGYPQEAPYTTPYAVNVRGVGPLEHRSRGGSRPMLSKFVDNDFGTQITAVNKVSYIDDSGDLQHDLIVVTDGSIAVLQGESVTTTVAYLTIDGDKVLLDGDYVVFDSDLASVNPIGDDDTYQTAEYQGRLLIASSTLKRYNPLSGAVEDVENAPSSQPLVTTYQRRVVLGGESHLLYFSGIGNIADWTAATHKPKNIKQAVTLTGSKYGEVSRTNKCTMNWKDKVFVFGSTDELWALYGSPVTGELQNISHSVGIIGAESACVTHDGLVVLLARDGLYTWPIGSKEPPQKLSAEIVPEELKDIDVTSVIVKMAYDHKSKGVHIFATPDAASAGEHWWFDLKHKAIWRVTFPNNNHQPWVVATLPNSGYSDVVLGCKDGYLRRFDNTATTDDGTAVNSDIILGPFQTGGEYGRDGALERMIADFATSTAGLTCRVVRGDAAETVVDNTVSDITGGTTTNVFSSHTFAAGHNKVVYPKARGAWCAIWIDAAGRWAYESLAIFMRKLGQLK